MPKTILTEDERKERKRLYEQKRKESIKRNPASREEFLRKDRERYAKRKAAGLIIPRSEMTPQMLRNLRKKNLACANAYYYRKKNKVQTTRQSFVVQSNINEYLESAGPSNILSNNESDQQPEIVSEEDELSLRSRRCLPIESPQSDKHRLQNLLIDVSVANTSTFLITSSPEQTPPGSPQLVPNARDLIVNVYKFLKEEYLFTMMHKDCNCDLSHLRNISRRTADATNVSLRTVAQVLSEARQTQQKNRVYKFRKAKEAVRTVADESSLRQALELMEMATLAEATREENVEVILLDPIKVKEEVNDTDMSLSPVKVKEEVEEEAYWKEAEVKTEVEEDVNCKETEVKIESKEEETMLSEVDVKEEADDYEITIEEHNIGY